jgi:hypothetical protein
MTRAQALARALVTYGWELVLGGVPWPEGEKAPHPLRNGPETLPPPEPKQ